MTLYLHIFYIIISIELCVLREICYNFFFIRIKYQCDIRFEGGRQSVRTRSKFFYPIKFDEFRGLGVREKHPARVTSDLKESLEPDVEVAIYKLSKPIIDILVFRKKRSFRDSPHRAK